MKFEHGQLVVRVSTFSLSWMDRSWPRGVCLGFTKVYHSDTGYRLFCSNTKQMVDVDDLEWRMNIGWLEQAEIREYFL